MKNRIAELVFSLFLLTYLSGCVSALMPDRLLRPDDKAIPIERSHPNIVQDNDAPPEANEKEALLMHWEVPEINLGFMDIPELSLPFIDIHPNKRQDGIKVDALRSAVGCQNCEKMIVNLANDFGSGELGNYDSLLIAKNGRLVFESYFKRGRINLPHPQSSAAKSYTSLLLGRAIQLGHLSMDDLQRPIISLVKGIDKSKLAPGADLVTLHHALTMSTGISMNSEIWESIAKQGHQGVNHLEALLEGTLPINKENMTFAYGTGHELVMQVIVDNVPREAKAFINDELFLRLI